MSIYLSSKKVHMQSLTPTREDTAVFTCTIYSSVYYSFKTDKVQMKWRQTNMNLSWNETVKAKKATAKMI